MIALSPDPPGRGQALSQRDSQIKVRPYDHHATYHDPHGRGGEPDPLAESSETRVSRTLAHAPKAGVLADEQWELASALLPRRKPGKGRRGVMSNKCSLE